jgi:hypothetical protein
MTPTVVSPPPAAAAAAAVVPPVQAAAGPDPAELQRQIDELKASNAETKRTAEFWYEKANKPAPAAAPATPAAEAEPDVDILDLATKGGKAFNQYLEQWAKKSGYVRGSEMQAAIKEKTSELSEQADLIKEYPDLKEGKSEFFQATALEYGTLKNQGLPERVAMRVAAERVALRFLREGKTKTPTQVEEEKQRTKEQARRDRAAAGAGDRGGGRHAEMPAEDDSEMTDAQKQIAVRMLVDDDTTPEQAIEKYKARATKGVAMRLK